MMQNSYTLSHEDSVIKQCPVCGEGGNDFKFLLRHVDGRQEWSLFLCPYCFVQFWWPFKHAGITHYKRDFIVRDSFKPQFHYGYHRKVLKVLEIPKDKKIKILDIGCGQGDFIAELNRRGVDVWGVDLDETGTSFIRKNFGLKNVFCASFEEFLNRSDLPKFDYITFFEVLEHVDNPFDLINLAKKNLTSDGSIIMSTPSRERVLVNMWNADFPPHHLTRWNELAIMNLFKKVGLEIKRVYYTDELKFIFESLNDKLHFDLTLKISRLLNGGGDKKVLGVAGVTKTLHFGAHIKDYILTGIPAVTLLLFGKIFRRKNGDMLLWLGKGEGGVEMENFPKVTIIIPTYNRAGLILRTLKSALRQNYKNFEVLIIDDSKDDRTENVVKELTDSHVRYIHNREKGNLPKARNQGVKESTEDTKYVLFLDDDNEILPDFLIKGVKILENNSEFVGVVPMSDHRFDDGTHIGVRAEIYEVWNSGLGNGSLLKKELFVRNGIWFNEDLLRSEEWEFGLRVFRSYKVKQMEDVLQIYYHHYPSGVGSTLSNAPLPIKSIEYFDKYYEYYVGLGGKALATFFFWLGKLYCRAGETKKGRGFFLKAFMKDYKLIYIAYYAFWLFPVFAKTFHFENVLYKFCVLRDKLKGYN